jgi:hypothetical protein
MVDIQALLDDEAGLANKRYEIHQLIVQERGAIPPRCWGMDDCSTHMMSMCPWRIDCDSAPATKWQESFGEFS